MSQWPFQHIRRESSWPMQGIVVSFAAAVLQCAPEDRTAAAAKMIERSFRIGARLAREFGMSPVAALRLAQQQIEREIPGASSALADARVEEFEQAKACAAKALER